MREAGLRLGLGNDEKFPKKPDGSRDLEEGWDFIKTYKAMEKLLSTGKVKVCVPSIFPPYPTSHLIPLTFIPLTETPVGHRRVQLLTVILGASTKEHKHSPRRESDREPPTPAPDGTTRLLQS